MRYRFLEFVVDTEQRALLGPDGPVPLRRQSFRVLEQLLMRAPAVVGKDELLDAVWGHQAVSATVVAQTVRELREALRDDAAQPRAILTKHRFGYQFIAPLAEESPGAPLERPRSTDEPGFLAEPTVRMPRIRRHLALWLALAAVLFAALGWWGLSDLRAPAPWPRNEEARRAASEGLAAARVLDSREAVVAFDRARAVEDTPRLALHQARVHLSLGDRLGAIEVLDTLKLRRPSLSAIDQHFAAAIRHQAAGRFAAAMEAYRTLHQHAPDDLDFALALFEVQVNERSHTAQATYDQAAGNDGLPQARRLLMSAQLAGVMRDAERQLQQSAAAIAAADESWQALIASARAEQADALLTLGRIDEGRKQLSQAVLTLEGEGLLRAAADAWLAQVDPALARGDLASAATELEALTRRMAAVGDSHVVGRLLHAQGRIALRGGNDEDALALFSAAAEQHGLGGNTDGVISALGAQSGPLRRLGRHQEAGQVVARALELAGSSASAEVRASLHGNLGNLIATDGRVDEAELHFMNALDLYRRVREPRWESVTQGSLALIAAARGDLLAAEDLNARALVALNALELPLDVARIHHNMARFALRRGDLDMAADHLDEAMSRLEALGHGPRLGLALVLRAEIQLLKADLDGAEGLLANALDAGQADLTVVAEVDHLHGRIALLRDEAAAARGAFESARDAQRRAGQRALAEAAELGLARVDLLQGRFAEAEREAHRLTAVAQAQGRHGDAIAAGLVGVNALLAQARTDEAEHQANALRAQIDAAPEFEADLEWNLLRARLDLNPEDRSERLRRALANARQLGQQLHVLRVEGELGPGLADDEFARWQADVERLGLHGIRRPRFAIAR